MILVELPPPDFVPGYYCSRKAADSVEPIRVVFYLHCNHIEALELLNDPSHRDEVAGEAHDYLLWGSCTCGRSHLLL